MAAKKITTPLTDEVVRGLRAGDAVEITGVVYQARDAAHKRIVALIEQHMFETKASFTDRAIRRFVAKVGPELVVTLLDLRLADNRGGKHPTGIKGVLRLRSRIREEMVLWMEENEYDNVQALIGSMSQKNCPDPRAFERANYIKTLQSYL